MTHSRRPAVLESISHSADRVSCSRLASSNAQDGGGRNDRAELSRRGIGGLGSQGGLLERQFRLGHAVEAGPGVRVLDIACGTGALAAVAARRGAEIIGMEFAQTMIAEAIRCHPGIDFRVGDAEAIPFCRCKRRCRHLLLRATARRRKLLPGTYEVIELYLLLFP